MADTTHTRLGPKDLPLFARRAPGVSDLDHVRAQWAQGPIARDSVGIVHPFPQRMLFAILSDDVTRQIETETLVARGIKAPPAWDFFSHSLLTSNGDAHKRRRGALARTFAFPLMRALRPQIRDTVDALLADATRSGPQVDVLTQIAGPLPARVIADVLGVPPAEARHFAELVYSAIRVLQNRDAQVLADAVTDLQDLNAYVCDLIARHRADPRDDFLSRFVRDAGDTLDETEIRVQIVTVIFGGSDTTRAQLAMALRRLLDHPSQWAMLCADPECWAAPAVEEALRYDPVVGGLGRVAIRDFTLDDVHIPRGTILSPNLVAALRDPDVYADPDRFDITRTDHPRHTPALGAGPHRCLGEALARVELEEALKALATTWPSMSMIGDPPDLKGLSGTRGVSPMTLSITG
ncbi:MAG: cytochrome [Rhodobacteraceae bacterium]|nr:cytochrome [Paracoccaceae bacterium]